jgi:hypothetical protein
MVHESKVYFAVVGLKGLALSRFPIIIIIIIIIINYIIQNVKIKSNLDDNSATTLEGILESEESNREYYQ